MGAVVTHAQLQAHRALRGNPDTDELLTILRELAADRRIAVREAVAILREARDQIPCCTIAAEIDRIIDELETAVEPVDVHDVHRGISLASNPEPAISRPSLSLWIWNRSSGGRPE
jgi:hypothetical protein